MDHEALLVTSTSDDLVELLETLHTSRAWRALIHVPPLVGPVYGANGVVTFALLPHGGSLDHDIQNDWRAARAMILTTLLDLQQRDDSLCVLDVDYFKESYQGARRLHVDASEA
jgi:hypothetical protein